MIVYTLSAAEEVAAIAPIVDLIELRPDLTPLRHISTPYLWTQQDLTNVDQAPEYVDVAYPNRFKHEKQRFPDTKWIYSYHGSYEGFAATQKLLEAMENESPDLIKVCFDTLSIGDFLDLVPLFHSRLILFGRGIEAQPTRLLSYCLGAPWIYTSREGLYGQIPLQELLNVYKVHRLSRDTQFYGVIKGPEAPESIGYRLYNPWFAKEEINALYCTFVVHPEEFSKVFASPIFRGLSITMPYKQLAYNQAKELSLEEGIRSINTYVDGIGYNTDLQILEDLCLENQRIAILGGGGVAIAFASFLQSKNAVTVFVRNLEKTGEFTVPCKLIEKDIVGFDWVIDTLPVKGVIQSVEPNVSVIELRRDPDPFYQNQKVKKLVSGQQIFLRQGAKQLALFFNSLSQ